MQPERARAARLSIAALAAPLLASCALLDRGAAPAPDAAALAAQQVLARTGAHLMALGEFAQADPASQLQLLDAARAAWEREGSEQARLRYALLLAHPGHAGHDAESARALLGDAVGAEAQATGPELALARVELQRVEDALRLTAEARRLQAELERERSRARAAAAADVVQRRLQAELDENTRLRRQLDEARAKLDAIANIESNITGRKPPPEGRRP